MTTTRNYIDKLSTVVRHYILGNQDVSTPVDLTNRIEQSLHINVLFTNSNDFDGAILVNSRTYLPEIVINNNLDYYQQQRVVAHELGYLILNYHWYPNQKFYHYKSRLLHLYLLNRILH